MSKSPSPLSFLWQALHLPSKNPELFSTVFSIYILSHLLLYIGFLLSISPLVFKLSDLAKLLPKIDLSSPEFTELVDTLKAVAKELLIFEMIYYVFLFVISCFLSTIAYYANSTTYPGELLTLKEVLNKVKGYIKGPLITHYFVALSGLVCIISFSVIVFVISRYFPSNSNISLWFFAIPLILFASLLLVYLSIFWCMGVAISLIEPFFYEIGAILHETELLNGKKIQVLLLILIFVTISAIINLGNIIIMKFSGSQADSWVLGFVYQILLHVMNLYTTMATTVLYYECNQTIGDGFD
ncbi:transmembrane protein [Rhynchospora pubera]|uniref:Transmembrane protein n=1 Tax=Rhynchospora pubera TaxID=906938 RepID=A0AAV8CKH1_9POAL|nr:transmembrane protein [Rhynchospora pubera]